MVDQCVRIHASFEDVDIEAAKAAAGEFGYQRVSESSHIVVCDTPMQVGLCVSLGLQFAWSTRHFGDGLLGRLESLSQSQLKIAADRFSQSLRSRFGFDVLTVVVYLPHKMSKRYAFNLRQLVSHLGGFNFYFVTDRKKPSWWQRKQWAAVSKCGPIIFQFGPDGLLGQPGKESEKLHRICERRGILNYGVEIGWHSFSGHSKWAQELSMPYVMTGDQ